MAIELRTEPADFGPALGTSWIDSRADTLPAAVAARSSASRAAAARVRADATMRAQQAAASQALDFGFEENDAGRSSGAADTAVRRLISSGNVHTQELALSRLRSLLPPLCSREEGAALLERMYELNRDGPFADYWTYRCFADALTKRVEECVPRVPAFDLVRDFMHEAANGRARARAQSQTHAQFGDTPSPQRAAMSPLPGHAARERAMQWGLAFLGMRATRVAANGMTRAPRGLLITAQDSAIDALRSIPDVEEAVQTGLAHFANTAGYPMTHPDDLAALRRAVVEVAATGGPRAARGHRRDAQRSATDALRHQLSVDQAVQTGLARFEDIAGHPMTHPADLAALRQDATELAANVGPRAPFGHRIEARNATMESMRRSANVDQAVQAGLAFFERLAGYPTNHPSDLAALRHAATQRAPNGGLPAASSYGFTLRDATIDSMQAGADHRSLQAAIDGSGSSANLDQGWRRGLARLTEVAGNPTTRRVGLAASSRFATPVAGTTHEPRAPSGYRLEAQNEAFRALQRGADVHQAAREGLARFEALAGYSMTHLEDLQELRTRIRMAAGYARIGRQGHAA